MDNPVSFGINYQQAEADLVNRIKCPPVSAECHIPDITMTVINRIILYSTVNITQRLPIA